MPGGGVLQSEGSRPGGALGGWLLPPDFHREREVTTRDWVEAIVEPLALVVLVGLFVGGITRFLQVFAPGWDSRFLGPLCLVAALAAFLYARRLARHSILIKEWAALLLPIALVLKFLPYATGSASLAVDFFEWLRSPASFFSLDFIVGLVLLLLAWWMTLSATLELGHIRLQKGELASVAEPRRLGRYDADDSSWRRFDHTTPLRNLSARVLWGGVCLTWLGAIVALNSAQLLTSEAIFELVTFRRPGPSATLANVVAYFAVGLLFLAEAAYVRRRTAWQLEQLEPPRSVGTKWVVQAALGLAVVVVVALLLPTSYTLTISELFFLLLSGVLQVVQAIAGFFMVLMLAILYPLTLLFPKGEGGADEPASMPPQLPVQESTPIPWLEVLQSLAFWLIALAVVGYLLSVLWRRRPPLPDWLGRGFLGRIVAGLGRVSAWLRRTGESTARRVAAVLPRLRPRPPVPTARPFRFLSLRRMGPRELIEYFYLSVVERAQRLGFAREPGETAAEFSRRLPERFPDSEPDLHELTGAFLEARYGPRSVDEGLVKTARARWQAVRAKLRARRLGRKPS